MLVAKESGQNLRNLLYYLYSMKFKILMQHTLKSSKAPRWAIFWQYWNVIIFKNLPVSYKNQFQIYISFLQREITFLMY